VGALPLDRLVLHCVAHDRLQPTPRSSYHHWQLQIDGDIAHLRMNVDPNHPFKPGYELKLNSYDLGVDIELADAVQRVRFEHPEVKVVVVGSAQERVFCAGANIWMLAESTHPFKVNFCKFTNETRLSDRGREPALGMKAISRAERHAPAAATNSRSRATRSTSSTTTTRRCRCPEVPLLGVLPGTGGLTRLVDKRKVRRDLADVFSTLAEGVRGKKAKAWKPRRRDLAEVAVRREGADARRSSRSERAGARPHARASRWLPIQRKVPDGRRRTYLPHVRSRSTPTARLATLTVRGPTRPSRDGAEFHARARSLGAPVRSANSTTRCCSCASSTSKSAWCCCRRAAARRGTAAVEKACSPASRRTGSSTRSCADGARAAPLRADRASFCTRSSTPTRASRARSSS
jgi:benzoyl-CoA-dihydrodiol lyase